MTKSRLAREGPPLTGPTRDYPSSLSLGLLLGAVLAGVAVSALFAFLSWNQTRDLRNGLDDRFAQLENRFAQLSTKVDQVNSRAAAPPQRGPDPNRVYTVETDGAPFKGPANAPITIVEFSDFQ